MASVKVKFRPSSISGKEGVVYYQITHNRKTKQLVSGYRILESEWNHNKSAVRVSLNSQRSDYLYSIKKQIDWDLDKLSNIIAELDTRGIEFFPEDIILEYNVQRERQSFFNFMETVIVRFRENGKIRTSETYSCTLRSFKDFRKNKDIFFDSLTSEIIEDYEAFLQKKGLVANTTSFHMRILRAVFNRAVDYNMTFDSKPFRRVYTGIDKTIKRALPLHVIQKIMKLDLSNIKKGNYARDIFLLSFYFRGMSFIDMALLKKTDLINGVIRYRRRKTGQLLSIAWTKEMQAIINKYPLNKTEYLLPIITNYHDNQTSQYRRIQLNINKTLRKIGELLKLPIPLTLYCSRHSWASIAKSKGIPVSVISDGLGHDNEKTTQIYLATIDTSEVDKANALIIKALRANCRNKSKKTTGHFSG